MSLDDVQRLATALPEVVQGERRGTLTWSVGGKVFAWERTFSKADVKRFGDATPPPDPIVAVRVGALAEKEAVLAAGKPGVFTIPHFDGFAAVLIRLDQAVEADVRELVEDAWLSRAPAPIAAHYRSRPT